jgi:hypothetical protein
VPSATWARSGSAFEVKPFVLVHGAGGGGWNCEGLATTPWRCLAEPVGLSGAGEHVPRTYVWCTQSGFGPVAQRLRDDPEWDYRELDSKHMCMYARPCDVARLLLECAA